MQYILVNFYIISFSLIVNLLFIILYRYIYILFFYFIWNKNDSSKKTTYSNVLFIFIISYEKEIWICKMITKKKYEKNLH